MNLTLSSHWMNELSLMPLCITIDADQSNQIKLIN